MIGHVVLGLLSRLVPNVQAYFVSMPGQILGGLTLLSMLVAGLLATWQGAVSADFAQLSGLH